MKVTVKCPCGRRQSHQVVEEGQQPAALPCTLACVSAGRQQQLAGAFGVDDPSNHISSFDRNRSAAHRLAALYVKPISAASAVLSLSFLELCPD